MTAKVIDGKAFAANVRAQVQAHVAKLREEKGIQPGLAVVLVGEDPASKVYVKNKHASTIEVGMASFEHRLPAETSEADLLALVKSLNADPKVHGILVQLPLPAHLNSELIINTIDPAKDVDGFHISNVGLLGTGQKSMVPCTPLGCLMMLRVQPSQLAMVIAQHHQAAQGRARHHRLLPSAQQAHVRNVEPVDILGRINRVDDQL